MPMHSQPDHQQSVHFVFGGRSLQIPTTEAFTRIRYNHQIATKKRTHTQALNSKLKGHHEERFAWELSSNGFASETTSSERNLFCAWLDFRGRGVPLNPTCCLTLVLRLCMFCVSMASYRCFGCRAKTQVLSSAGWQKAGDRMVSF